MKVIFVLACWMGVAQCGVIPWSAQGEAEALELYHRLCQGRKEGEEGNFHWHCKRPLEPYPDSNEQHVGQINGGSIEDNQAVFIEIPSKKIHHHIEVDGEARVKQNTKIYVLPPTLTHSYDVSGKIVSNTEHKKPETFFIKGGSGGGQSGGGSGSNSGSNAWAGSNSNSKSKSTFDSSSSSSSSSHSNAWASSSKKNIRPISPLYPQETPSVADYYRNHRKRSSTRKHRKNSSTTTTTTTPQPVDPVEVEESTEDYSNEA